MNKYQEMYKHIADNQYQYGTDEDWELFKQLVDKVTPKKIKETDSFFLCPSCNQILETKYEGMCIDCLHERHYCPKCGQKLDWGKDE